MEKIYIIKGKKRNNLSVYYEINMNHPKAEKLLKKIEKALDKVLIEKEVLYIEQE